MAQSNCLRIINAMPQQDQDALLARLDELQAKGLTPKEAQLQAAIDVLAQVERDGGITKSTPRLTVDVPSEEWLQGKIDYAIEKGRNRWGVPHMSTVTASFRGTPVDVPVSILEKIPGQRDEQNNRREDSLDYIRKHWDEVSKEPPYIEVAYNGEAWVSEGNHRIMVAAEKGVQSLPVEIRYFDGGERKDGPLAPARILQESDGDIRKSAERPQISDPPAVGNRAAERDWVRSTAESLAKYADDLTGPDNPLYGREVQHSGSAAGPSSYFKIGQAEVRVSTHSKGAFNSAGYVNVFDAKSADLAIALMEGAAADYRDKKAAGRNVYLSTARQTDTPQFKRWFGDSKVVDENGEPLVVYHGTNWDFDAFDDAVSGKATGKGRGTGLGFWFTEDSEAADIFSRMKAEGGNIMPVYLSIRNPYRLSDADFTKLMMKTAALSGDEQWKAVRAFRDDLIAKGYDGIKIPKQVYRQIVAVPDEARGAISAKGIILPPAPAGTEGAGTRWVAFGPTQIKSAIGNNGQFDPTNPDITKSTGRRNNEVTIDLSGDKPLRDKAKAWIAKVNEMFPRNPMNERQRVMMFGEDDMVIFELDDSVTVPGATEVKWFQAYPLRSGNGTKGMQELQRLASEDNMALTLYPWDRGRVSQRALISFYKKNGFEPIHKGGKDMVWRPEPGITKSADRTPLGFYSALAKGIDDMPTKQAPAGAWKTQIKGLVNKGLVKADEVEWSGINDWLDLQQGKVTKQQVADYLEQGGVQVEETVLGDSAPHNEFDSIPDARKFMMDYHGQTRKEFDDDYEGWSDQQIIDSANDLFRDAYPDSAVPTKYSQYTLPGGENYREILLTLPTKEAGAPLSVRKVGDKWYLFRGEEQLETPFTKESYAKTALQDEIDGYKQFKAKSAYRSSHWDQENVLAHIRVNDRTDADGKRVLFVEELQSDWGQEGKKKGFADPSKKPVSRKEFDAYVDKLLDDYIDRQVQAGEDRQRAGRRGINMPFPQMAQELGRAEEYARMRAGRDMDMMGEVGIPAAPFVTKTEGWLNLALKRVMIMAVEGGYDRVAFVNGEQSAARYSLSKAVSYMGWSERKDGGRMVALSLNDTVPVQLFVDKDGVIFDARNGLSEAEGRSLDEVIGKDVAQKVMSEPSGELEGEGLNIGGEGMKAFYDTIVPLALKKLLPKVGGGQMGTIKITQGTGEIRWDDDLGREVEDMSTAPTASQPGFDVTPAMREKVAEGLPLFSRQRVFHGTPHRGIDKFSTDHIGTGEGVQAYGWGLYFASRREIAEHYRKTLAPPTEINNWRVGSVDIIRNGEFRDYSPKDSSKMSEARANIAEYMLIREPEIKNAYEEGGVDAAKKVMREVLDQVIDTHDYLEKELKILGSAFDRKGGVVFDATQHLGQLYEVEIPQNSEMLDWDKPLSEQEQADLLREIANEEDLQMEYRKKALHGSRTGEDFYKAMSQMLGGDEAASRVLNSYGIKGIKYLDGTSRSAGDGSYNYVVFGGDDVAIQQTYYSRQRQTETPEFKRWFGDSKVVDGRGRPLVVYHGTGNSFSEFKSYRDGLIFMSTDPDFAWDYGEEHASGITYENGEVAAGVNVMPLYASVQNPWDYKNPKHVSELIRRLEKQGIEVDDTYREGIEDGDWMAIEEGRGALDAIKEMGHDGIWMTEGSDMTRNIAVFSPTQIKSAIGNSGAFDPANPDIRKSAKRQTDTPAFKRWFGDSKVVDEKGEPLRVYHGPSSPDAFTEFNRDSMGWFAPSRATADTYANSPTIEAYLSIKNPVDVTKEYAADVDQLRWDVPDRKAAWRTQGYDGVKVYDSRYGEYHWIPFDPTQIKSAIGNSGAFDPNNPDIRKSAKRQTDTPAFKRWFGDSKVVDENGEPLVVYHGTKTNFSKFKASKNGLFGIGSYFTSDPEEAGEYSYGRGGAEQVLPVYLSLQRPYRVRAYGTWSDVYEDVLGSEPKNYDDEFPTDKQAKKLKAALEEMGHDGLVVRGPDGTHFVAFEPTQIKSAIGNNGEFDPANPDITKSTGRTMNALRDASLGFGYKVADLLDSSKQVSWWDKTVGTMYHLAQKHPEFKRVYDAVQRFIGDVSSYATRAADLAPGILPKLETLKDVFKSPLAAEDVKALAGPIFEGTLRYTRDDQGEAVLTDDVGLAGVVWRDEELRQKWGLDDRRIGLYREFRRATNKSIADLAVTDMVRYAGDDAAGVQSAMLQAGTIKQASEILVQELERLAAMDGQRAGLLQETIAVIKQKANAAQGLIAKGYAPLSRYGDFTVYVTRGDEQLYFGMYETQREANQAARQMREQYPDANVQTGTMSKESHKLFSGVTPETLALFGESVGLEASGSDKDSLAFQAYLKLAKSNRSAMKRLIERKGVEGFSEDVGRVLAGFVYSNARQASTNLHLGEIGKSANAIRSGDLKDQAIKLMQYVQNPQEEAQALRGLLFAQYIGGSLASAAANLTQSLTTTFPTLGMHFGIARAGRAMTDALAIASKGAGGDADLQAAMKRAEEAGITAPQEVHQLMAQSQGRGSLKTGDGTRLGDALAKLGNTAAKVQLIWGKAFGWAEQINRKVAFVAAYKLAREKGIADPFRFAEKIVADTQFVMNKGNNPNWARGAVGSTLFTFKKFMVSYLEGLVRMYNNGPEGKKALLLSLGILFLLSGVGGLPGSDDLDDLIDGIMQRVFNKNFSSKQEKREFFAKLVGDSFANFVLNGVSGLPGAPIDVSGRLGLGNPIPGTGILTKKTDHSYDLKEVGGAAADFVGRLATAAGQVAQGDVANAAQSAMPVAAANVYKALEMARLGYYKDAKNRKVIDTDLGDAVLKGIGFQPSDVADVQQATRTQQQLIGLNKLRETEIADLWTRGRVERDPQMVAEAQRQLAQWNRDNPLSRISISQAQINRRVIQANMDKAKRIAATAPKEIRDSVKRELDLAASR